MSELSPEENHEIKHPFTYQCPECNTNVKSAWNNTVNVKYTKQPWFNHIRLVCDSGDYVGIMWYDQQEGVPECAEQFMSMTDDYCDDTNLHELRIAFTGATTPEVQEFSDRKERFIEHWGEFLQATVVNVTDFL